jgi:hypothetical protein
VKHVAILGAGPIGLEAALAASESGLSFTIYEAAGTVAGNVRSWGHVQLFTPWSMNVSPRARAALVAGGHVVPAGVECPTGSELVERVLEPLAELPAIAPHLRCGTRVLEVGREGLLKSDEIGTGGRRGRRFRLLLRNPDGTESVERADVVLDCTGSYDRPNALGTGGIRAPGEESAEEYIIRRIPDLESPTLVGDAPGWRGLRILLVGSGHSAQTTACDLADLVERAPETRAVWAIRSAAPSFGAVEDDALPMRDALVQQARALAFDPESPLDVRVGRTVESLRPSPEGIRVTLGRGEGDPEEVIVDRIISLTGAVGDARMYRQLQVHECYATSGPMKLAAAILSSGSEDCLTQAGHGAETLVNPEPDFYILGMKSYGRNSSFLMRVGWEQVDEVFTLLGAMTTAVDRSE